MDNKVKSESASAEEVNAFRLCFFRRLLQITWSRISWHVEIDD